MTNDILAMLGVLMISLLANASLVVVCFYFLEKMLKEIMKEIKQLKEEKKEDEKK